MYLARTRLFGPSFARWKELPGDIVSHKGFTETCADGALCLVMTAGVDDIHDWQEALNTSTALAVGSPRDHTFRNLNIGVSAFADICITEAHATAAVCQPVPLESQCEKLWS